METVILFYGHCFQSSLLVDPLTCLTIYSFMPSQSSKRLLIIAFFTIALILLVNSAWWLFYQNTRDLLDQQLGRRLTAVGSAAAAGLSSETITGLVDLNFEAYLGTIELLSRIKEADSLAELFILDESFGYLATTAIDDDSVYFLKELNGAYIDSLFFSADPAPIATPSYQSGDLYLKSAFVPLLDSSFYVVAVLGVEANVDYFQVLEDLRSNLIFSTAVSVLGGLLFGAIFLSYQRRMNSIQARLFMNETHSYLGRMVAVVSHEIKNPLMIIRASAERLLRKTDAEESRFVVEEVDRLNSIVTGYLDFARSSGAGGGETMFINEQKEKIDLNEFIANLRKQIVDKYPDKTIDWIAEDTDHSPTINNYPRALRQVLLNLLLNSAEACIEKSMPIAVGISVAPANGRGTTISVVDRGPGMNKKQLSKIFDPFYTTRQTGSGLGLYLSKNIVEQMNGRLDIDSTPGQGTTITIELPD